MYLPSGREVTKRQYYKKACNARQAGSHPKGGIQLDQHSCALFKGHSGPHRCTDGSDGGCGLEFTGDDSTFTIGHYTLYTGHDS